MTRDEILALDGRELDAAVAEKVMLFRVDQDESGRSFILSEVNYKLFGLSIIWSQRGEWYRVTGAKDELFPKAELVKRYSSDANAARLVLAEVEGRGDEYAMVRALRVVEPSLPDVGLEYGEIQVWQVLRLAPKQICQAALLAVEGV